MIRVIFITILSTLILATNVKGQVGEMQTDTVTFHSFEIGDTIVTLSHLRVILTDTVTQLSKGIDDTKNVILLSDKEFSVKISLSDFVEYMDSRLSMSNPQYYDKKLLEEVLEKAKRKNTVNASRIRNKNLKESLEYRTADLLTNGKCLILNKRTNEIIPEIRYQTYRLGVLQGRRFFVSDRLILETIDIRFAANNIDPVIKQITIKE